MMREMIIALTYFAILAYAGSTNVRGAVPACRMKLLANAITALSAYMKISAASDTVKHYR